MLGIKNKFKHIVFSLSILIVACQSPNKEIKVAESQLEITDSIKSDKNELTFKVDTFSKFPSEIDGCACYFSANEENFKKGNYIYVNNYDKISFMKINGKMIKFNQTEFKKIDSLHSTAKFKSDNYQLIIDTKNEKQNGDETWLMKGNIKIFDLNKNELNLQFYGECGC